jgi:hypothetical protein
MNRLYVKNNHQKGKEKYNQNAGNLLKLKFKYFLPPCRGP